MAIGTLAAIGIGLAGVGSAVNGISKGKAANKATAAATDASAQNNALARDIYSKNDQALSPYMERGNAAGDTINALLGLGGQQPAYQTLPAQQPNALAQFQGYNPDTSGGVFGMPRVVANDISPNGTRFATGLEASNPFTARLPANYGVAQTVGSPQQAANNAFDIFRNSTGYQFRLGQGMDAINGGYAGAGTLQSGAAMKAINEYGQNFASNEFGNYMGYLGNQQGVGLSGASALAGVGQNYANSVMTNNNNAADAIGNAALYKGANNPFANALGTVGGGLFKLGG